MRTLLSLTSFLLSHVYTGWTIVQMWDIKGKGHVQVTMSLLWDMWHDVMFVCVHGLRCLCPVLHVRVPWPYYMYVKVLMGPPRNPFFSLSCSGNSELQENNPALVLCCGTAHCPWRCVVYVNVCVLYVYLCTDICVRSLLPSINSVWCVPPADSVEDDGCTRTSSSAPPRVSAAAAALEQGFPACSRIHTDTRTTPAAQSPPPGWGQTHTHRHTGRWMWRILCLPVVLLSS